MGSTEEGRTGRLEGLGSREAGGGVIGIGRLRVHVAEAESGVEKGRTQGEMTKSLCIFVCVACAVNRGLIGLITHPLIVCD